jgi:NhaC family Na+:H+ antiporter
MKPQTSLPLGIALLPLFVLMGVFVMGALFTSLGGALVVVAILAATVVAGGIGSVWGIRWVDMESAAIEKLAAVFPVVLILLAIGGLIGAWMISGTIPFFVWIGLKIISPEYLVISAFLTAAIMSIFTGSSWASAGTIGVALMGLASVLDAPLAMTAGAIVSGAYFGDKMSPVSDSTNISAIAAGTNLYTHIGHMVYTALPSVVIAIVIFSFAPGAENRDPESIFMATASMSQAIEASFVMNLWVLLPPGIVLFSIWRKWPPVLGISGSSLVALVIALQVQSFSLVSTITAYLYGFNVTLLPESLGAQLALNETFLTLVNRGGIYSMVNTLVVIIAAFLMAGAMQASGALSCIVTAMLKAVKGVTSLIASTMLSGIVLLSLTSHGGVTSLIVGNLYQRAFKEQGLAPENLSRSIEDSVTLTEPLMPWTVSGVFMATTLGVPTLDYLPWALFCIGGPVFSLLLAMGYKKSKFGLTPIYS